MEEVLLCTGGMLEDEDFKGETEEDERLRGEEREEEEFLRKEPEDFRGDPA